MIIFSGILCFGCSAEVMATAVVLYRTTVYVIIMHCDKSKHVNTMSDLDSNYVSTITTTNVTYKHTHPRYRTVATETRREKCKAEWEGRFAFVCYTHYSSQFVKSNEAHTP